MFSNNCSTGSNTAITNISPYVVAAFGRGCCDPKMLFMSCLQIKNVKSAGVSTAFEYCVDLNGNLVQYNIPQVVDQTPIDMAIRGNVLEQNALAKMWERSQNCPVDLLILQRACNAGGRVKEAGFFDRAIWLYGLQGTGSVSYGNDTIMTYNAKSPALVEDQYQFIPKRVSTATQYSYSMVNATLPVAFTQMDVIDNGSCGTNGCGCPVTGCQMVVGMSVGNGLYLSTNGGASFAQIPNATLPTTAHGVSVINGIVYYVTQTGQVWIGVPNSTYSGISFSQSLNSPAVAPTVASTTANIIQSNSGDLLYAGSTSQVWASQNGQTWNKIANGFTVVTSAVTVVDFWKIARCNGMIYGVGRNAANTETVFVYSNDDGYTWALGGYITQAQPDFMKLNCTGDCVVANIGGTIYRFTCNGISAASNPAGIPFVADLANCDCNCYDSLSVTNTGIAYRSMDALLSGTQQSLGFNVASSAVASSACCNTKDTSKILFNSGVNLVSASPKGVWSL